MVEYVWDALRPLTDVAIQFDPVTKIIVLLLSFGIFVISLLAYKKARSQKLLFVSIAFLLFSLKWLVKAFDLFFSPGNFLSDSSENVFEFFILVMLFFAIFRK